MQKIINEMQLYQAETGLNRVNGISVWVDTRSGRFIQFFTQRFISPTQPEPVEK